MKQTSNFFNFVLLGVMGVLVLGVWRSPAFPAGRGVQPAQAAPTALDADCATGRTVQVSGAAVVNVTPDRALIQLGVQSNGNTPDAARSQNQREIQRVIEAVRGLGVEAKDIATDRYIVYPVYGDYNSLEIKGYRIDNTVSITLRDVGLAEDVILTALKVGANEVQDVQFYTSELRKYRDQARELAMKAAGEKAQALAQSGGAAAGCVLTISENTWTQYYGSWRGGRETALWAQNVIQNAAPTQPTGSALDDSPITLGQIAVRAEINATYSLK